MSPTSDKTFTGSFVLCFAYDIGDSISLPEASEALRAFDGFTPGAEWPLPLRISPLRFKFRTPVTLDGVGSAAEICATVFHFGTVSFALTFHGSGDADALKKMVAAAHAGLAKVATFVRPLAEEIFRRIYACINRPNLSDMMEDYIILRLDSKDSSPDKQFVSLVTSGDNNASSQIEERIWRERLLVGKSGVALVGWNAALLLNVPGEQAVTLAEFLNAQLLATRVFGEQIIDDDLLRAYQALRRKIRKHRLEVGQFLAAAAWLNVDLQTTLAELRDEFLHALHGRLRDAFQLSDEERRIGAALESGRQISSQLERQDESRRIVRLTIMTLIAEVIIVLMFGYEIWRLSQGE